MLPFSSEVSFNFFASCDAKFLRKIPHSTLLRSIASVTAWKGKWTVTTVEGIILPC